MDRASQVLAQDLPTGIRRTYATLSDRGNAPISILYHRDRERRSKEELARSRQQYLTPEEEKALVKFLFLMYSFGHPVQINFMRSLVFGIGRRRSKTSPIKRPGPTWSRAFEKRHLELKSMRIKPINWKWHDSHIYDKVVEWFEIIGKSTARPGYPASECL